MDGTIQGGSVVDDCDESENVAIYYYAFHES